MSASCPDPKPCSYHHMNRLAAFLDKIAIVINMVADKNYQGSILNLAANNNSVGSYLVHIRATEMLVFRCIVVIPDITDTMGIRTVVLVSPTQLA